jgi:hypothetical protein
MAQAHHLGDAASVVLVGFDGARGKKALGMAHLNTHDRYARLAQSPVSHSDSGRASIPASAISRATLSAA